MRLGGEVDHHVDGRVPQEPLDERKVPDVPFDQFDRRLDLVHRGPVAGVGQGVQDDQLVVRVAGGPVADEVGADEPGAAGDEEPHVTQGSGPAPDSGPPFASSGPSSNSTPLTRIGTLLRKPEQLNVSDRGRSRVNDVE